MKYYHHLPCSQPANEVAKRVHSFVQRDYRSVRSGLLLNPDSRVTTLFLRPFCVEFLPTTIRRQYLGLRDQIFGQQQFETR